MFLPEALKTILTLFPHLDKLTLRDVAGDSLHLGVEVAEQNVGDFTLMETTREGEELVLRFEGTTVMKPGKITTTLRLSPRGVQALRDQLDS